MLKRGNLPVKVLQTSVAGIYRSTAIHVRIVISFLFIIFILYIYFIFFGSED